MKPHIIDLSAPPPVDLIELGKAELHGNQSYNLNYLTGNMLAAIDEEGLYPADIIDVSSGEVWRIPNMGEEYVPTSCFGDDFDSSVFYLRVTKGSDAPSHRLLKMNMSTKEVIWQGALSKVNRHLWHWAQDKEHLYYDDNKNVFSLSKQTGKLNKKYARTDAEDINKKGLFPSMTHGTVFALYEQHILLSGYPKTWQLTITCLNPLGGTVVWTKEFGKLERIIVHALAGDALVLLCASGKLYKIKADTGELLFETDTGHVYEKGFGFYTEADILLACLEDSAQQKYVIQYNCKTNMFMVENVSDVFTWDRYSGNGIIKNGVLYCIDTYAGVHTLYAFDIAKKTVLAKAELGKGHIKDFILVGNYLYLLQNHGKDNGIFIQFGKA